MSAALAPSPEIAHIVRHVAEHYGVPAAAIMRPGRPARIVEPRSVAMFLACALTSHSLPELGRVFGKHHTTVLAARDRILERAATSGRLAAKLEALAAHIGSGAAPAASLVDVEGLAERVARLELRARWGQPS